MVSCTARNEGAETDGGSSLPPARITNVAGIRALVDPPPDALLVGVVAPVLPVAVLGVPDCSLVEVAVLRALVAVVLEAVLDVLACDVLACLELPHAPTSRHTGNTTTADPWRLTRSA